MFRNQMTHDRPLDSLIPGLTSVEPIEGMEQGPLVHPSVLQVELEDGYEWLYAIWAQPTESEVNREFRKLLKVTQMVHVCDLEAERRRYLGARIALFEIPNRETSRGLAQLGFKPGPYVAEQFLGRMLILGEEAASAGWNIPKDPASIWFAPILRPAAELEYIMNQLDESLSEEFAENAWGERPGNPGRRLLEQLRYHFSVDIEPNLEGLKTVGLLLLDHRPGALRWLPPAVFMALCDLIGVAIQHSRGCEVGWAAPAKLGDFPAPPSLQIKTRESVQILPIASALVEWAVMPLLPGNTPILADLVEEALDNAR